MKPQFHTLEVPVEDRVEYWRHVMADSLSAHCSIEPRRARLFDASLGVRACGDIELLEIKGSPYQSRRHGPGRADWVSVMFLVDGFTRISCGARDTRLGPGDACLVPADCDMTVDHETDFRLMLLEARVDDLSRALPSWRKLPCQRLEGAAPGVKAASDLTCFMIHHHDQLPPGSFDQLGATALQLLARLCDATERAGRRLSHDAGAPGRHRARAERFIMENLHDSNLSVALIAQEIGISKRYLHSLFQDGANVMQWVIEQRLQACRREISARGARSIADVAYSCGFSSPAHFSRAFKQRFGICASEL